ncbi:MAG TPA: dihydroorotase [Acidobacteriota bacterium]|nr:dihydroorotase [Acidobacteriota bacterium]
MKTLIRQGLVVDPSQDLNSQLDVLLQDGKVEAVDSNIELSPDEKAEVIEAQGCVVCPGLIDMHVHLREPGREDKETIDSGSRAAAAGGFTSVMCMPNTDPVIDNESVVRHVLEQGLRAGRANICTAGAVTKGQGGEELAEIGEMKRAGIVALSDDGHPVMNSQVMRRAMEYARVFGLPVLDHCEDKYLSAGGCMNESSVSTRLGLNGMAGVAEEVHIARDVMLSRLTGCHAHICHVSTAEGLQHVRRGKVDGIAVTTEVCPHHFTLADADIKDYDTNYKMSPPLRTRRDLEAMLEGLKDGSIDCIATDHAPHTSLEKDTTFEEAAFGIIGLETSLPLCIEFLLRKEVVSLSRLIELMSTNPARILGLDRGTLKKGSAADVTIFDPEREITVDASAFESKSRNTPYHGWNLHGLPLVTIVSGRIVHDRR